MSSRESDPTGEHGESGSHCDDPRSRFRESRRARKRAHRERRREWYEAHRGTLPFARWKMHRRIFASLAGSILIVTILMGVVVTVFGPWGREDRKLKSYVAEEFREDWADPTRRSARAKRMTDTLGVGVRLTGAVRPAGIRTRFPSSEGASDSGT